MAHLASRLPTGVLQRGPTSHLLGRFSTSQETADTSFIFKTFGRPSVFPIVFSFAARLKVTCSGDFVVLLKRRIVGMPKLATLDKQEGILDCFHQPMTDKKLQKSQLKHVIFIVRPNYLIVKVNIRHSLGNCKGSKFKQSSQCQANVIYSWSNFLRCKTFTANSYSCL